MGMICIAVDHNENILGICFTKELSLAKVYFQGQGIEYYSIKQFLESALNNHPTGVIPILSTEPVEYYENGIRVKKRIVI